MTFSKFGHNIDNIISCDAPSRKDKRISWGRGDIICIFSKFKYKRNTF